MVTMSDVSKAAGVSSATVSRVINHPEIVDIRTRDKVQAAITALNSRRNEVARGLASQSSRTIGVVVSTFASTYFGRMMEGVSVALREQDFHTIVESSNLSVDGERRSVESLISRQVDALVLYSYGLSNREVGELMNSIPTMVLIDRLVPGFEDRCVALDNEQGGAMVAQYLLDRGHVKVAMIEGHDFIDGTAQRSKGFTKILQEAGYPVAASGIVKSDFSFDGGQQAMQVLIDSGQKFTAVFAHNDQMAAGAIDTCREAGLRVPHDVSIIGFDDLDVAFYASPKLTTVGLPLEMMGRSAAELAHALATGKPAAQLSRQRYFVPEIVERESVRQF